MEHEEHDLVMSDDDTDWKSSSTEFAENGSLDCRTQAETHNWEPTNVQSKRVIVHIDMDCFYAQVEMIRNPSLRDLPIGIQQKTIIVTCNYVSRGYGVTKLMSVSEAKGKCPQLVLLNGEDLTHYREVSYKVTALLENICPLVERLGFDENFVDVTEMVEQRLKQKPPHSDVTINGHIYNQQALDCGHPDHARLAEGSHIAAELRAALHTHLGLTGCAGVASSKVLAKLVSGTFKPNQQTTLLPESTGQLVGSLEHVHALPGVGYRTCQRLQALGVSTVLDLQRIPLHTLERELGAAAARRIYGLSLGIDPTPVVPSGPPQSLSDEDSFKKVSTEVEVVGKVKELLSSLVDRMTKDGRVPRTLRLTIRRFSVTNKWTNRESRQCPVPSALGQKIRSGSSDALAPLLTISMKLFHRMIDTHMPFHLTLISVCFSNLQSCHPATRGTIQSFFSQGSPAKSNLAAPSQGAAYEPLDEYSTQDPGGIPLDTNDPCRGFVPCPPPGVDPGVFRELPENIQRELMSSATPVQHPGSPGVVVGPALGSGPEPSTKTSSLSSPAPSLMENRDSSQARGPFATPNSLTCNVPPHVDPEVFSELPAEVQAELLSEWKHETPLPQTPPSSTPGRSGASRGTKPTASSRTHANSLLKYFKPR